MAVALRRMNELCEITSSKRIFAADYVDVGVPFYRGKEITEKFKGNQEVTTELFIDEEKFIEIERKFGAPVEGDLLLTSVGTLGSPYVVDADERFYFKDGNLTWFRKFKGLDSRYLYYWLVSPKGKAELQKCTIGSSQSAFTIALLKGIEIELPSLTEQRRIAGILSAYDELIANNQRRIAVLEQMARALYREWFVYFRAPGVRIQPGSELPEGWEVKRLVDLMQNHIGGGWGKDVADDQHTEPAYVIRGADMPEMRQSDIATVPFRYHTPSNLKTRRLLPGDIIFEVSGGTKDRPVGRTLIMTEEVLSAFNNDVICASFCKRVTTDDKAFGAELMYLSLMEGYDSGEIEQYQVQSTGISNFKWTEFIEQTTRFVPSQEQQERFREIVKPIFSQITTIGLQSMNLRQTRDLLLPRLMGGRMEVNNVEE